jgi:tetratricopeptide (TPR) repeat protein
VDDPLRALWDFSDLDVTERRFREQLTREPDDGGRAEVLTQLARVQGLRGRFDEGHRLLDEAAATDGAAARVALERGRLLRSSGDGDDAFLLFEEAYRLALAGGEGFVAGDAAHMAALSARGLSGMVSWTQRGIELAEANPGAEYWLGPLLNNLGWAYYGAGDYDAALEAFERALAARERYPEQASEIEIARYAVGKTLRALGQAEEAAPLLEQAVAAAEAAGRPDGWFHEELAEIYAALGREDAAREQARLALPLLHADDPSLAQDAERSARLRGLAGPL